MKCMNCEAEILPQYVKAIETNVCPGCGEQIYNDSTKELMEGLKQAMEIMPNNPQGIAGWLLSNFHIEKIGSGEPVSEFYGQKPRGQNKVSYKGKRTGTEVDDFFARAGFKPSQGKKSVRSQRDAELDESTSHLAKVAQMVNNSKYDLEEDYGEEEEGIEDVHYEAEEDMEGVAEFENSVFIKDGGKPLSKQELHAMNSLFDTPKRGVDVLEMDRLERLAKQQEGGFRRQ